MGCGLTANGIAALAASLSASSPDKAPLAYFRTDPWALRPGTTRLALSAAFAPGPDWRKAGVEGLALNDHHMNSANDGTNGNSSTDDKSGGRSGGSAVRLYGLGTADLSLLCAMLGKNNEVNHDKLVVGACNFVCI